MPVNKDIKPNQFNRMRTIYLTICILSFLWLMNGCEKNEKAGNADLTNTTWECDTTFSGIDYYYLLTFISESEFDYYENGLLEFEEKGTYSYNPPKIDLTIWGITIEGSVEGDKLYYPTLETIEGETIVRIFTRQ